MSKTAPKKEEAKETKAKTTKTEATTETKKVKAAPAKEMKAKKPATAKKKAAASEESSAASQPKKACQIKACKREYKAKGYCGVHYKKWRQGEYGKTRYTACSDSSCFKPQGLNRFGYCEEHFQNYYVKGMHTPKAEAPKKEDAVKADEKAAS